MKYVARDSPPLSSRLLMNQDMKVKVFWDKCCVTGWVVTDILNDHSVITFRVKQSSWTIWFWKWRHYDSLKHWKLPTQQQSVTFHKISVLWKTQIPTEDGAGSFAHLTHEEYDLRDKPQRQTCWHKSVTVRTLTAMEILKNVLLYKEKMTAALHK